MIMMKDEIFNLPLIYKRRFISLLMDANFYDTFFTANFAASPVLCRIIPTFKGFGVGAKDEGEARNAELCAGRWIPAGRWTGQRLYSSVNAAFSETNTRRGHLPPRRMKTISHAISNGGGGEVF